MRIVILLGVVALLVACQSSTSRFDPRSVKHRQSFDAVAELYPDGRMGRTKLRFPAPGPSEAEKRQHAFYLYNLDGGRIALRFNYDKEYIGFFRRKRSEL